jgi:hypothetical protein
MAEKHPIREDELEDDLEDMPERGSGDESEEPRPVTPDEAERDMEIEDRFEASDN